MRSSEESSVARRPRRSRGVPRGRLLTTTGLTGLRRIEDPDVDAVLVRRALHIPGLSAALPEAGFHRTVPVGRGFAAEALLAPSFGPEAAAALGTDIERLHALLDAISRAQGQAELAVTSGDECRKFHVDFYRLRLLVSYVGPGTELLPEFALDRSALGKGGDDAEAANRAIVRTPDAIVRARAADVVLLKGARYGSGLSAVHRSPPIAGSGLVRLILKMTIP